MLETPTLADLLASDDPHEVIGDMIDTDPLTVRDRLEEALARIAKLEAASLLDAKYEVWLKCNRGITDSDWNEFLEEQETRNA